MCGISLAWDVLKNNANNCVLRQFFDLDDVQVGYGEKRLLNNRRTWLIVNELRCKSIVGEGLLLWVFVTD